MNFMLLQHVISSNQLCVHIGVPILASFTAIQINVIHKLQKICNPGKTQ